MHKSRIIISVNPKFMINSQDVYFGIVRQCAQVGVKNINIFNMKNHLFSSDRDRKHFYKKIYMITLCNFWHRSWSWPNTQHIQKLATEELWFLSYCRSRVFTFVFFMQNLQGISSC
jgi:hypothetical protein